MSINEASVKINRERSPNRLIANNENDNELLRDLVKTRGILKSRLTKFSKAVSDITLEQLTNQKCADVKLRMQGITSLFAEFSDVQTKIEKIVRDSDLDSQLTQRELFEDCYYHALAQAECLLKSVEVTSASSKGSNRASQSIKLPTISLPVYDGTYEHWIEYRDIFLSLVHNSDEISDIQKFHYLKSSLKGSAELVIDSLEFSASNYVVAWELLLNRYNNSSLLVHNHVKALFTIQKLSKESPHALRKLTDIILRNLRALKILGEPTEYWDTLIIFIITSKLDETTEREWEQFKCTTRKYINDNSSLKVDDLLMFLRDRADMLETLLVSHRVNSDVKTQNATSQQSSYYPSHKKSQHKVHCNVSTNKSQQGRITSTKKSCLMCNADHPLYSCQTFLDTNLDAKLQFITANKLCENCLRPGHSVSMCKFGPCRLCFKKHNTLIHNNVTDRVAVVSMHLADNETPGSSQMTPATVAPPAQSIPAQIHSSRSTCEIRGVGNTVTTSSQICDIEIKSRIDNYSARIKCFVLPHITSTLPTAMYSQRAQSFMIPDYIQLADPQYYESQNIDILIGADLFWDLLCEGKMRLPNGPFLQNTRLGWIISGPIEFNTHNINTSVQCNFTQSIDTQLRRFWELEDVPKTSDIQTDEERSCEEAFIRTTTRNSDGRFCVSLPLKQSPSVLGESLSQAERRFLALERRLERNSNYKKLYIEFIHEYIELGHMTRVTSYGTPHYFLPHHGVYREHSSTTKLRVVFDASAATSSGVSLNDIQQVGPPLQRDLVDILLRFRQHRYTACADVEKMYRQCLLNELQRDLQLIVWRDNPSEPLGIYRLNTVTYGTASAPFLSVRCLKQLALECKDSAVQQIILNDFYVDDMITGSDDKEELLVLCKKVTDVLSSGGFHLRKWIFNFKCDELLVHQIPNNNASQELTLGENVQCKTLGLGWYYASDEFYFNTQVKVDTYKISKRTILSHVSQIFDPLGLLSPTIIIAKVLLQKLWLLQLGWDDEVPRDVLRAWTVFVKGLSMLNTIRIPRHVTANEAICTELHIFTDASQTAYGACIYVRTVTNNGLVSVKLLCSKGKVAPLKPVSIPRLELCGALLGARLYDKVIKSLRRHFDNIMFWTDSTIVLGWLHMSPNLQKTFVQNRTAEIHELVKELPWRHVSGKENPADLVSRGVQMEDLSSSTLWWEGPFFLRHTNFSCNNVPLNSFDSQQLLPELKSSVTHSYATDQDCEHTNTSSCCTQLHRRFFITYVKRGGQLAVET
ncbi:uncharacterized protein LOC128201782 [Galleria mellonella]|uniref:Uncharacterized protein LOC128201782 n=1 Tax=Galleria mellonella TaxID=7137 RepID=A0ABM3MWE6_GALME|nr:uncharacterized protein LOC128201782 [Galleria mellonella]